MLVAHISNKYKRHLPFNFESDYIEDVYQSKIMGHPLNIQAKFIKSEVLPFKSAQLCLW